MRRLKFYVDKALQGERVDRAILSMAKDLSRKKVRAIIDVGAVYINRKRVRFASRTVNSGDLIEMAYNPDSLQKLKRQNFTLQASDILFHRHGLIAINKPPGLPSQPTRDQSIVHVCAVVEKYLKANHQSSKNLQILHRLDKETSGVFLLATDNALAAKVMADFKAKNITKVYHAVCQGQVKEHSFVQENYLSSINKKSGLVKIVRSGGKPAYTAFEVMAVFPEQQLSLIKCMPKTGRSHQIRVHLEAAGLPILGDKKYGTRQGKNLPESLAALAGEHHLLHAHSITLDLPAPLARVHVTADYPKNFTAILETLRSTCHA